MVAPNRFGLSQLPARTRRGRRLLRLAAAPALFSLVLSLLPAAATFAQDDEAEPPAGDYTVAITEDDIPSDLVNGPDLIGRWQVFLRPDGTYSLGRADIGEVVTGSYTIEDETITVTDEAGLLSCVNAVPTAGADVPTATGTYGWQADRGGLTLSPIEDGCAGRRLILSTRPLDFFVACATEAIDIPPPLTGDEPSDVGDEEASDDTSPTDPDEATEDDEQAAEDEQDAEDEAAPGEVESDDETTGEDATTDEDDDGGRVLDDPFGGGDNEDVDLEDPEAGIDAVLDQLSACWTTQDPARILPLFGSGFLDVLVEDAGSLYDVAGVFGQIMAIPISWERAGEIEVDGDQANCLVSQTIGAEESFVGFDFVLEDGAWKLDSFG